MKGDLSRKVLKDVSRSFYLSLRFLPREFRAPTSVAYLLARASDTIADAGQLGIQERRDLLARFVKFVTEGKTFRMPEVKGLPEGEKVLMSRLDDCMAALENLPDRQQVSVRKVVKIITEGQCWDLDRFAGEGVVSLDSDDELRTYTYQVAGCVGEFWTEIGIEEGGEVRPESAEWTVEAGTQTEEALRRRKAVVLASSNEAPIIRYLAFSFFKTNCQTNSRKTRNLGCFP